MKNIIINIKENYKLVLGVLVTGLFLGWLFFHTSKAENRVENQIESHDGHDHSSEDPTTWTCSMHPQIKQDKPGQCPICAMDLIPLTSIQSSGDNIDPDEIVMTEAAAKLAQIQTMSVTKGTPQRSVYLQGKIHADERNISELTARFGGRIEKLFVNFTGQNVKKGEKLATLYSPDLVTAQRELLEAITFKETRPSFYVAARAKLKLWDLTDDQIDAIEEEGEPQLYFDILSPISGTVMMRHVALGDYVKEGSALFMVTDLSKIWVMFDAYESDLPWIKIGDHVDLTLQSMPGKPFDGNVTFIDPFINPATRVTKVRIELPNPGLILKPEMFANGVLHSKFAESDQLLIPKSSVLWTGKRAVVYISLMDRESPSFLYREITLGPEAGNFYVVADGLAEGEVIAVNGVFKIDAAAQLEGKPSMMNPTGGKVSLGHNHGGTPMSDEEMEEMDEQPADNGKSLKETPMDFKMQLGEVMDRYLMLKDAFVNSNEKEVEAAAKETLDALNKVDMTILKGDAHNTWMKLQKPIKDNLNGIIQMKGIEMKRSHFSIVTDKLLEAVKQFGIHNTEISALYIEFCPMAFDNDGAYWISESKEIKNPYFGDAMLGCGEIRETLQF